MSTEEYRHIFYSEETLYAEWGPEAAALREELIARFVAAVTADAAERARLRAAEADAEEFLARMYAAQG